MNTLLKFIPVTVLHHLADTPKQERTSLPQCQAFKSPVLVTEVKSFYRQSYSKASGSVAESESRYNE